MKSLYNMFQTDQDLEIEGVWQDLGVARIKIARAGNRNTEYLNVLRKTMKRYNKVNMEALSAEDSDRIMAEIFAKAVIKAWEVKDEKGKWKSGLTLMENGKEKVVPATVDNVVKCLTDLPDLFAMLREWADDIKTFQSEAEKEEVKNS